MRIVIAEDSVLLRAGLTRILADAGEDVVATVGDADELLRVARLHEPDLAIIDVRMPPTHTDDGLRAALQIRAELPPYLFNNGKCASAYSLDRQRAEQNHQRGADQ